MSGVIKCFTTIGALFVLLFGLALFAGSIYIVVEDDVFLGNNSIKWTSFGIIMGVALLVITVSANAIYGICRGKPCLICCFQIFVIIFMVLFLGMGLLITFSDEIVFDGGC